MVGQDAEGAVDAHFLQYARQTALLSDFELRKDPASILNLFLGHCVLFGIHPDPDPDANREGVLRLKIRSTVLPADPGRDPVGAGDSVHNALVLAARDQCGHSDLRDGHPADDRDEEVGSHQAADQSVAELLAAVVAAGHLAVGGGRRVPFGGVLRPHRVPPAPDHQFGCLHRLCCSH